MPEADAENKWMRAVAQLARAALLGLTLRLILKPQRGVSGAMVGERGDRVTGETVDITSERGSPGRAVPSVRELLRGESLGAMLSLTGAVLYGTLFLAYQAFYAELGLTPEEVGVNYAFLLTRSLGFAAVTVVLVTVTYFSATEKRGEERRWGMPGPDSWQRSPRLIKRVAVVMLGFVAISITPVILWAAQPADPTLWQRLMPYGLFGALVPTYVSMLLIVLLGNKHFERNAVLTWWLMLAGLVIGVVVAFVQQGEHLGREAVRGLEVKPERALGLTLLDLDVSRVVVTWVGPVRQRPARLFTPSGVFCASFVAQNNNTAFLLVPAEPGGEAPSGAGDSGSPPSPGTWVLTRLPLASIVVRGAVDRPNDACPST